MKRTLIDTIGRKLLVRLYKTATATLKKHNSELVIMECVKRGHESKTEYTYKLEITRHKVYTYSYRFITVLLAVSDLDLLIEISGYGRRILDITDKESIDTITKFVQEACTMYKK